MYSKEEKFWVAYEANEVDKNSPEMWGWIGENMSEKESQKIK